MTLGKDSKGVSVSDYFVNPINNQTAVKGLIGEKQYSYSDDTSLSKYLSESAILEMVQVNSEIRNIFSKFEISLKINMSVLENLTKRHLPQTRATALGMVQYLPQNLKAEVNLDALAKATILHDIAKVIMPESIVNKAGSLTEQEREIMEKHAQLSYEMLKNTDLDKETLNLIKNHHHENSENDINLQILSMADIYSALREKRCYKPSMSKEMALEIINTETKKGKFSPQVYNALSSYLAKKPKHGIHNFFENIIKPKNTDTVAIL